MQESLEKIAATWMNVSLTMKNDPDTDKAFGWVLEMLALPNNNLCSYIRSLTIIAFWHTSILCLIRYGYAVASALHGVRHILHKDFMIQVGVDLFADWCDDKKIFAPCP